MWGRPYAKVLTINCLTRFSKLYTLEIVFPIEKSNCEGLKHLSDFRELIIRGNRIHCVAEATSAISALELSQHLVRSPFLHFRTAGRFSQLYYLHFKHEINKPTQWWSPKKEFIWFIGTFFFLISRVFVLCLLPELRQKEKVVWWGRIEVWGVSLGYSCCDETPWLKRTWGE